MKEPDEEKGWHIEIAFEISSMYVRTHACTKTVRCTVTQNTHAHHFGHTHQWSGDLMPNAGRREKGPKCGSLPLNAGELAALL